MICIYNVDNLSSSAQLIKDIQTKPPNTWPAPPLFGTV